MQNPAGICCAESEPVVPLCVHVTASADAPKSLLSKVKFGKAVNKDS